MKKKSGLADSPFFPPSTKQGAVSTPLPQDSVAENKPQKAASTVPPVRPEEEVRGERQVRDVRGVRGVRPVRPKKRVRKHHPFDIYVDQLEALRKMKMEAMMQGIEKSMASMVREALDRFIEENR